MLSPLSVPKIRGGKGKEEAERPRFKTRKNYQKDLTKSSKNQEAVKNQQYYCVAKPCLPTEHDLIEI